MDRSPRWALCVPALALACQPQTVPIPQSDPTPPTALWLQANPPEAPLANVTLGGNALTAEVGDSGVVHLTATGSDPEGLRAIRLWMTVKRSRPGQIEGPGLAGAPVAERSTPATAGGTATTGLSVSYELSPETVIGAFDELWVDLWAEGENFGGGTVKTAVLTLHLRWEGLRLHVIGLSNDDGTDAATVTAAIFVQALDSINRVYRGTRIRFRYDPATDYQTMPSTALNQNLMFNDGSGRNTANLIAAGMPTAIPLFLRKAGGGNGNAAPPPGLTGTPPGIGIGGVVQNYVSLPSWLSGVEFIAAHEIGHYLGLYHTFPGWGSPAWTSEQAVLDSMAVWGGTIAAFDGDLLPDTPPDPESALFALKGGSTYKAGHGHDFYCDQSDVIAAGTVGGAPASLHFYPDMKNVMSYYAPVCPAGTPNSGQGRFTRDQVARMHQALTDPARSQLVQ